MVTMVPSCFDPNRFGRDWIHDIHGVNFHLNWLRFCSTWSEYNRMIFLNLPFLYGNWFVCCCYQDLARSWRISKRYFASTLDVDDRQLLVSRGISCWLASCSFECKVLSSSSIVSSLWENSYIRATSVARADWPVGHSGNARGAPLKIIYMAPLIYHMAPLVIIINEILHSSIECFDLGCSHKCLSSMKSADDGRLMMIHHDPASHRWNGDHPRRRPWLNSVLWRLNGFTLWDEGARHFHMDWQSLAWYKQKIWLLSTDPCFRSLTTDATNFVLLPPLSALNKNHISLFNHEGK